MEQLFSNFGLNHISEEIFLYLNRNDLLNCRLVNKTWKNNVDHPNFWLKKYSQKEEIPKESFIQWRKFIENIRDPNIHNRVTLFLIKIFEVPKYFCVTQWETKSSQNLEQQFPEDSPAFVKIMLLHMHQSLVNYRYERNYLNYIIGRTKTDQPGSCFDNFIDFNIST